MNAIFGIVNLSDRPVDPAHLSCMRSALTHRGPDGGSVWVSGSVGLGCQMMKVTRESRDESLPLQSEDGNLQITSAGRLDNREDLFRTLDIPVSHQISVSDSQLIVRAYAKWEDDCCRFLEGDFAFAIWDNRRRRLFCATDQLSVCPVFYYKNRDSLIFSTEIRGIRAVPGIAAAGLNLERLAALAVPMSPLLLEQETFFKNIYRLPKASYLTACEEGIQHHVYWEPAPDGSVRYQNDQDWIEAFHEVWFRSVRARLRTDSPVAALLSGGLDSSSIVATAAQILEAEGRELIAISAVLPKVNSESVRDERSFIDLLGRRENVKIHYVTDQDRGPYSDLERLAWSSESPQSTSRHYLYSSFIESARAHGARIILDGVYGELGPSNYADGYFAELFLKGSWISLARELRQRLLRQNKSIFHTVRWHVVNPLVPYWMVRLFRRPARIDLQSTLDMYPMKQDFVQRQIGHKYPEMVNRIRELGENYPDHQRNQLRLIQKVYSSGITGMVGYEHASWSFPYLDKRLLEFCLAVPGNLKLRDGWHRYLVRIGLEGILPPEIQWRTSKEPFSPDYHRRFNRQLPMVHEQLSAVSRNDPIHEIVDVPSLLAMSQHEMTGNRGENPLDFAAMHVLPAGVYLIHFLRQFDEFKA